MITIQGLTDRQKTIMEMMWTMDSMDRVTAFIRALPTQQDQRDAASLVEIAVAETIEQEGGLDRYAQLAQAAIASAQR